MKKILAIVLAAALALSLTACGNSSDQNDNDASVAAESQSVVDTSVAEDSDTTASEGLTTVRAAVMTNGAMHWYAVIGDETGIFEQHGIKLEISEFAAGINTVDAIVTEQADIGNLADYAAVNRIGNTQDSTNLRIVSRISTSEGTANGALYVNPDQVSTVEDLANQGFATQPGTVWDYWIAKTYEYAGIPEEEQVVLNCDSAASAVAVLTSGEGVAFWANGVNATKLEEAGFEPLLTLDELELYTDAYYIVPTTFLEAHPDIVEEYLKASKETAEWIYANEDEAAEIIESRLGVSAEQFKSDLAGTQLVLDFTQGTLDHLNGIKDWAVSNGSFADYDLQDYTDLTALEAALPGSVTLD